MHIPIHTIIFLAVIVGIIALQIFLSRQPRKWPGLVLPILSLLFSLIYLLNMTVPSEGPATGFAFQMVVVLLFANIPTAVLLAIYFACRGKSTRNTPIDKMNIQDLD